MNLQIAREIYLKQLDTMKKVLDLIAFKMDKRTNDFKYARSQVMNYTYENLKKLFKHLIDEKIIEKCECGMSHPKVGIDIDRVDYMSKIRGTPVFPSRFEFILREFSELTGESQLVLDKRTPRQYVTLRVERMKELSSAEENSLITMIRLEIKNRVGITVDEVILLPSGAFEEKFEKTIIIT